MPAEWNELYSRMKAKLVGYLHPEFALKKYSKADTSVAAAMAERGVVAAGPNRRGVATDRRLIAAEPKNPYFYQAKGQMLFENGHIAESLVPFKTAAALAPKDTDEIHTEYAQALLEKEDDPREPGDRRQRTEDRAESRRR